MNELHDRWVSKMLQEKRELKEEKQELIKQNQIMWNALDYIIVAADDYKEKSYGVVLAIRTAKKAMEKVEESMNESEGDNDKMSEWRVKKTETGSKYIVDEDKHIISVLSAGDDIQEKAQLIAAAPELLEALKEISTWWENWMPDTAYEQGGNEALRKANEAIRKAEGDNDG